ncbi:30S ribosomal protein S20 [Candidatus Shikimatogenerans bostrichidophilus]|uniref:30S ribosomal protein S20 n=1 Tax=Candidatus Shikimatogenerans bostrichidophilus TaxID=2943807 RepID=UPI002966C982
MSSKSVLKRQKQNIKNKLYNRYYYKTTIRFIRKLKHYLINNLNNKKKIDIKIYINHINSMLDKITHKKIIHINKASRIKSKICNIINKYIN